MLRSIKDCYDLLDKKTRRKIPVAALFSVFLSVMEAVGLGLLFPLLQAVMSPEKIQGTAYLKYMYDLTGAFSSTEFISIMGTTVFVIFIGKNILSILLIKWMLLFTGDGEIFISEKLMSLYSSTDFIKLQERNSSELIRNVNISGVVSGSVIVPMLNMVTELSVVIASVTILVSIDFVTAFSLSLYLFVASISFYKVLKNKLNQLGQDGVNCSAGLLASMQKGLGAAKELRVLERQENFLNQFSEYRKWMTKVQVSRTFLNALPKYYLEIAILTGISLIAIVTFNDKEYSEALATLALFGAAGIRLLPSVNRLLTLLQTMRVAIPYVEMLKTEVDYFSPDKTIVESELYKSKKHLNGINIEDVSFKFLNRNENVIENINLNISLGGSLGIVGQSGAGKSTLIDILLGLYKPSTGGVFINNQNIHSDLKKWRHTIGYVPQKIYLIDDTVAQNIAFGVDPEDVDEERIWQVLEYVRLKDVVLGLPENINCKLGENGMRLSGGQQQRIGFARALYHDPDIIVMDEATSALDNQTEFEINNFIKTLNDKTFIIIAHRLSTVRECDNIAYMDDGRLVALGKFVELVDKIPEFARMVTLSDLNRVND